ncbi:MAG: ACP S-malonyltransferase [Candidatus Omnitrophica bacterium]|nr:ACP S-malonyltransferase [Candidatus Omnitrophota bacterium]
MNKKIAYIFPGQGAQYPGMGKDLYESSEAARRIFEKADNLLGFSLSNICFNASSEELKRTDICQPAILTVNIAALAALEEHNNNIPSASFCAGLSLGEYAGLVAADVFTFEDALKIVCKRGQFMEEAASKTKGAMAAIIGLDEKIVRKITSDSGVYIANLNCPGQIVISGEAERLKKAAQRAKEAGALKVINLEVSGAFHSPLMKEASDKLLEELSRYTINPAKTDIVFNATAQPADSSQDIKDNLVKQVASSVLWENSMRYIINNGVSLFIELGPGKVLKGLLRRIDSSVDVLNLAKQKDVEEVVSQLMAVV